MMQPVRCVSQRADVNKYIPSAEVATALATPETSRPTATRLTWARTASVGRRRVLNSAAPATSAHSPDNAELVQKFGETKLFPMSSSPNVSHGCEAPIQTTWCGQPDALRRSINCGQQNTTTPITTTSQSIERKKTASGVRSATGDVGDGVPPSGGFGPVST